MSSSGKIDHLRQLLAREWLRLFVGCVCVAVLASGLVVMVSSAEAGWLTTFTKALKNNPWLFGSLLTLGLAGAVLPIVAVSIRIWAYRRRNRKQTAQGG
jgi:hypothetical protein